MIRLQLKMMKGGEEKEGRMGYDERRFKKKRLETLMGEGQK